MSTIYDRIFIEKMSFSLGNGNLFSINFTQVNESDSKRLEEMNRLIRDPKKETTTTKDKINRWSKSQFD